MGDASRDTIDVKRAYIDVAGVLLSQIVYWFLPNRAGESIITEGPDGRRWLRKERVDRWEECRVTPKSLDRESCCARRPPDPA